MEQNPSREAASRTAIHELRTILCSPRVHHLDHNSPWLNSPKPDESSSHHLGLSLKDTFYYHPPTYVFVFLVVIFHLVFSLITLCISHVPNCATCPVHLRSMYLILLLPLVLPISCPRSRSVHRGTFSSPRC
jgi:hypothetical protein